MKRTVACAALLSALYLWAEEPIRFDHSRDVIEQNDYRIRRIYREPQKDWVVEVRRGQTVMHRIFAGAGAGIDFPYQLSFGIQRLIPGSSSQVVVRHWTGGGHCCTTFWIVNFAPSLGIVLDTSRFEFDGIAEATDIDGDGTLELAFTTTTFDYFGVCYACSPKPLAWFQYDAETGRYLAANHLLFPRLEPRQKKLLRELPTLEKFLANDGTEGYFRGDVLDVVLPYLYAGRDKQGWAIYESRYPFDDRRGVRELIQQRLDRDAFVQELRAGQMREQK